MTSDDRGAVAVEAAIIVPLLLILLLGIIDAALYLRDLTGTTAAVRHGARIASAEPRRATLVSDTASAVAKAASGLPPDTIGELWVYQADASGSPLGGAGVSACPTRCVRLAWQPTTGAFEPIGGSWPPTLMNACLGDTRAMAVGVALTVHHRMAFSTLLGGAAVRDIVERSVMKFEPMPARSCGLGVA